MIYLFSGQIPKYLRTRGWRQKKLQGVQFNSKSKLQNYRVFIFKRGKKFFISSFPLLANFWGCGEEKKENFYTSFNFSFFCYEISFCLGLNTYTFIVILLSDVHILTMLVANYTA